MISHSHAEQPETKETWRRIPAFMNFLFTLLYLTYFFLAVHIRNASTACRNIRKSRSLTDISHK